MEKEQDQLHALSEIRDLMKQSSRFLSLSGLSGVCAGVFALAGAVVAWLYLREGFWHSRLISAYSLREASGELTAFDYYFFFFADAGSVLLLSLASGWYFSQRKAKKSGIPFWDHTAWRALLNLMIPLITGGLFCLILLWHGIIGLIPSATLIFYGLGLLNASKYTLNEIRYLGICQIALGLAAMIFVGYGLLFWAFGFGVLHIVYGAAMYFKYER